MRNKHKNEKREVTQDIGGGNNGGTREIITDVMFIFYSMYFIIKALLYI